MQWPGSGADPPGHVEAMVSYPTKRYGTWAFDDSIQHMIASAMSFQFESAMVNPIAQCGGTARGERFTGLAALFAVVNATKMRAVARQRVDAAITGYRGPFGGAVATGLRAAAEQVDLTEAQIANALQMFAEYEAARGSRRTPKAGTFTDAVCAAWERGEPDRGHAWEIDALQAYERERGR